jgi:ADP-heptose:LPS heptosyltransferase
MTQEKTGHKKKLLLIRFSSFGDIAQAVSIPYYFKKHFPDAEVDWLTREDFAEILAPQKTITKVIPFSRKLGVLDLIRMAWRLSAANYTHVYDAHNNLRSEIVAGVFFARRFINFFFPKYPRFSFIRRPKNRFRRFLLFKLRLNTFERPFIASRSFLKPLEQWGIFFDPLNTLAQSRFEISTLSSEKLAQILARHGLSRESFIALVPSAAWEMKRWPLENFKSLIGLLPHSRFVVLGGPQDTFCEELAKLAPERVLNLSGQLSLIESSAVIELSKIVISADTGLLHVGDQMQKACLALMGPAAFGFPSSQNSVVLSAHLSCQPCSKDGRGKCINDIYQKCMLDLTPRLVAENVRKLEQQ